LNSGQADLARLDSDTACFQPRIVDVRWLDHQESHIIEVGISLRSATEPIDDTSTGKLMEGVLAAFAQFDNDVRSDRTRAGMKAALELGRWVFLAPIGYLNAPRSMGRSLVHDPERAPLGAHSRTTRLADSRRKSCLSTSEAGA
jgi:DNA invertase Pin-like site-specific DNA recombinase